MAPFCPQTGVAQCDNIPGCPYPQNLGRKYNTLSDGSANAGVQVYIDRVSRFADALRSVDTTIKVGAVGYNYCPTCPWNTAIINDPRTRNKIDFLVDHPYAPITTKEKAGLTDFEYSQSVIDAPYHEKIYLLEPWKSTLNGKQLAITEHNGDYGTTYSTDEFNDLRAALFTAGRLNQFLLNDHILLANFWHFRSTGIYHTWTNPIMGPLGMVYKLYGEYIKDKIVSVQIQNNPVHQAKNISPFLTHFDRLSIPDLDAIATNTSDGKQLSIFLINRNIQRTNTATLNLGNFQYAQLTKTALKTKATGLDALLANTLTDPKAVYIDTESSGNIGQSPTIIIPPHTFMVFEFKSSSSPLQGDINHDGKVDIFDYNILITNFGQTSCGNPADIDGNCRVDIFDYNILVSNFGK